MSRSSICSTGSPWSSDSYIAWASSTLRPPSTSREGPSPDPPATGALASSSTLMGRAPGAWATGGGPGAADDTRCTVRTGRSAPRAVAVLALPRSSRARASRFLPSSRVFSATRSRSRASCSRRRICSCSSRRRRSISRNVRTRCSSLAARSGSRRIAADACLPRWIWGVSAMPRSSYDLESTRSGRFARSSAWFAWRSNPSRTCLTQATRLISRTFAAPPRSGSFLFARLK